MTQGIPLRTFRLYGTSACHLCEIAQGVIEETWRERGNFTLEKIDISGSDDLFGRYGEQIPVLQHPDGRELYWPFSGDEVIAFVDS